MFAPVCRASRRLGATLRPEKCSWTYPMVSPELRRPGAAWAVSKALGLPLPSGFSNKLRSKA